MKVAPSFQEKSAESKIIDNDVRIIYITKIEIQALSRTKNCGENECRAVTTNRRPEKGHSRILSQRHLRKICITLNTSCNR
jgi:hypothetical protein